jgi:septum formation inhibitor-activating ATPase MinD
LDEPRQSRVLDIVGDHANHPNYDRQIIEDLVVVLEDVDTDPGLTMLKLQDYVDCLKIKLINKVANGDNIVNDVNISGC